MSDEEQQPSRIIVKKTGHGTGHHGGAWKVAYADFVTTMMALFIVLWIVGQSDAVKQGVAQYFRDPGAFPQQQGQAAAPGGAGILPAERAPERPPAKASGDEQEEEAALQQAAERMREVVRLLDGMGDQVRIEVTREGLRIELVERENSNFFQVGSAIPLPSMRSILGHLQDVLVTLPNPITIEGHTDSRRYSYPRQYSNWELSTDRANSARRLLDGAGLPPGRIDRVIGHADRLLLVPSDPLHPSNRRITIVVRRHAPTDAVDPGQGARAGRSVEESLGLIAGARSR